MNIVGNILDGSYHGTMVLNYFYKTNARCLDE